MRFRNRLLILVVVILVPAFIGAALVVAYVYLEQQKDQERGVAETGHAGEGTGLGLPQAYAFAAQAGGLLTLESAPGRGTRVHIHLPRADATPAAPVAEAPAVLGQASGSVLFVEDDPLVREAVAGGLRQAGFTVRVAENGDTALALLDGGLSVDIVFSDIVMPGGISGIDLARAVRRRWPNLPVVLATGYTGRRVALPEVPILAKPYDIAQAVALLGGLVAHH